MRRLITEGLGAQPPYHGGTWCSAKVAEPLAMAQACELLCLNSDSILGLGLGVIQAGFV